MKFLLTPMEGFSDESCANKNEDALSSESENFALFEKSLQLNTDYLTPLLEGVY